MSNASKIGASKGVFWSAIERFSVQGAQFFMDLLIARMVLPAEYGLIAMLAIFRAIAQTFIDSGFGSALVQKKDRNEKDFSTVFYFNALLSLLMYVILFYSAPHIASFYGTSELSLIAKVIGVTLIINSLGIVQQARMTIELNFKKLAVASLSGVLVGGVVGIAMAYMGCGVWALVVQNILNNLIRVIVLWVISRWKPSLLFSIDSFRKLFSFGSKLLLSSILHTLYMNIYTLIIGKKYHTSELGFYSRASSLSGFPSINFTTVIDRAVYPILCRCQDDPVESNILFLKCMKMACYVIFPMMIALAAVAEPLVRLVLTDVWIEAVPLLQIMCVAYMWDPVMRLNHSVINSRGRSDYFLIAEILKKAAGITILLITIPFGIKIMCIGLIGYSFADMGIIIYFNRKLTGLGWGRQARELIPLVILSFLMGGIMYAVTIWLSFVVPIIQLIVAGLAGLVFYAGISMLFKFRELKILLSVLKREPS